MCAARVRAGWWGRYINNSHSSGNVSAIMLNLNLVFCCFLEKCVRLARGRDGGGAPVTVTAVATLRQLCQIPTPFLLFFRKMCAARALAGRRRRRSHNSHSNGNASAIVPNLTLVFCCFLEKCVRLARGRDGGSGNRFQIPGHFSFSSA